MALAIRRAFLILARRLLVEWWEQSPGWVGVKTEWQVWTQKQDV